MSAPERDACGIGFVADAHGRSSRSIVQAALAGLAGVKHRGAVAADERTSDGCGVLAPIPTELFGVGHGVLTLFARGDDPRPAADAAAREHGLRIVDWRVPPMDPSVLGEVARAGQPTILQAIIAPATTMRGDADLAAYKLRRAIEATLPHAYAASCSFRTIVYKGLVPADHLADFFLDLADERFAAPFAIFHQRFSTNTTPSWERSQPFRLLCHNGEINTIWGNENRLAARARLGTEAAGLGDESHFWPVIDPHTSDSGKLDEVVELLWRGGRSVSHAMAMVVPVVWEEARDLDPKVRGFHEYHSALMEPWDGPAGVVFTDGAGIGATLDRNGLRPLRYAICEDGFVVCASEMGAVDVRGHGRVERGRLGPGHMLFVDPEAGVLYDGQIKTRLAARAPYAQWAADGFRPVGAGEALDDPPADIARRQVTHGFTKEELAMILRPMAAEAYEPTFSMGDDSPLPSLAGRPRPLYHFFRQRFAQVTNPAIDPLRERMVMSLRTLLGARAPLLSEGPDAARLLTLESFFLYPSGVSDLYRTDVNPFAVHSLDATVVLEDGPDALESTVASLASGAAAAVRNGAGLVVIDDGCISPERAPIPSLLALGAVHQRLVADRLRSDCSIIVVSDDVRDTHGMACLLGYGADAICPRLALQTVAHEADSSDDADAISPDAQHRFQAAIEAGVLKILSKMGISTVDSYRGAQIFEILGLGPSVVDLCFSGTPSVLGGLDWHDLAHDIRARHEAAFTAGARDEPDLESPGWVRVRKGGEYHAHSKEVVDALNALALVADTKPDPAADPAVAEMAAAHLLQRAIRGESYELYETFARLVNERPAVEPNDLLELDLDEVQPIGLGEVEPATDIVKRFSTGAMSHGALSKEAHENLARAMNLIGALSNCGEGGEDPSRFRTRGLGRDDRNSRIKQVASGRFGVTPEYLAYADEIQIKISQGSKPGEGGQLPGHKVSKEIARLRFTQPGVGLISPPPHHDIYSIEDLAQLVFDLKQVNASLVSVKLVAEDGVGTIAAGCIKALSDVIHLSGHNGGTGASPLSSIKHAGLPWEIGLADTQQALRQNDLRSRARLRVDGGFKTGRQVIIAALLGADEYSFGTAAMIAEGCIMLRACHRDTCKPGVATQRPNLRANFAGTPEGVASYFLFVAEEVRRLLASLGARSLDEVIGRTDLLRQRVTGDARIDAFDLSPLLANTSAADGAGGPRRFVERVEIQSPRSELGDRLLADAFRAVWDGDEVELAYRITNADRAVGAALAGAIALEYGSQPPRGTARVRFTGSAGQSFGAFLTHGIELELDGEANDYVGKGMAGGRIVIRPPADDVSLSPDEVEGFAANRTLAMRTPALAGNTCLYGATGGELFIAGAAGERFAVRNSGALAIVSAVGDHCCEYMTGGTVVVLGRIGYNFGAGMTGGQAFVWDPSMERILARVNGDLVETIRPDHEALGELRWLVERHADLARSGRAAELLDRWDTAIEQLWHIVPRERAARIASTAARRVTAA